MKKSTILIPLAALALSGCVFTPSKPSSGTTGGNPTSQQPGPGDSGTPQPGTSDSSGGGGGGGTTDTSGTSVTPTPTGHGTTKEDPLTPQEAIAKCDAAGAGVVVDNFEYFVGGLFDSGTSVNTEHHQWYGNLNGTGFKISGATNDSGVTVDEVNGAMDGKTVVVKGFIELYNNEYKMGYLPAQASPTGEKYVPSIVSISSEPAQDAVLNVAINGGNQSVAADGSLTLSATVTVSGSAAKTVTWSSSNSGVATIDASSGVVSPVAEGKTTIRATSTVDSTKYGEIELTVVPAGSVEHGTTIGDPLTPAEAKALCDDAGDGKIPGPNKEYFVKGEVENAALNSNRYNADFVDSVFKLNSANNDSGVTLADASALNNKIVTAKGYIELYQGTYKMGYLPAQASPTGAKYNPSIVAIEEKSTTPTVNSVSVSPAEVTKYTGDASFTITPTVNVSGGAAQTVSWSVSQGDSVSVDNGTVSILKAGVSKVRATSTVDSSKYAECTVTVNESAATSVTVTPATQTLQVNASQAFSSSVEGVGNFTQSVTWSVIPASAGTITTTGMFTAGASAASDVKIRATSTLTPSVYGEATVQIQEAAVTPEITGITGLKSSTSLEEGQTEQLSATVEGIGTFDQTIDWESSDPSKVTVEDGLITAVAATTDPVSVTAYAHGDHSFSQACQVTVTAPVHVNSVQAAYEAAKALTVDSEGSSTADSAEMTFTGIVTGTIGDSFYVQDGSYGIYVYNKAVTGIEQGKSITVTSTLKVYKGLVETSTVSSAVLGSTETLPSAQTILGNPQLQASNQAVLVNASGLVAKADVSGYSGGSSGSNANTKFYLDGVEITVSFNKFVYDTWGTLVNSIKKDEVYNVTNAVVGHYSGTNQLSITAESTFVKDTSPRVLDVSIDGGNQSVNLDGSLTLSATVNAQGDASTAVTWSSSNSSVATIDSSTGALTLVSDGQTQITATSVYDNTKLDTITLTVNPAGSQADTTVTWNLSTNVNTNPTSGTDSTLAALKAAYPTPDSTFDWSAIGTKTYAKSGCALKLGAKTVGGSVTITSSKTIVSVIVTYSADYEDVSIGSVTGSSGTLSTTINATSFSITSAKAAYVFAITIVYSNN